jgi:hypothetical protein
MPRSPSLASSRIVGGIDLEGKVSSVQPKVAQEPTTLGSGQVFAWRAETVAARTASAKSDRWIDCRQAISCRFQLCSAGKRDRVDCGFLNRPRPATRKSSVFRVDEKQDKAMYGAMGVKVVDD